MLSPTRLLLSLAARRGICTGPRVERQFSPRDILKSDLVQEDGLVAEKVETRTKKNTFDEADHISTNPQCYGTMNFMVEGFDIVVVEKFAQYVHKLVLKQKIKVAEVYALPTEFLTVRHLGEEFTTTASDMQVDAELPVHLRVVQVLSLLAVTAPILLQFLSTEVPPGVKLSVHEYKEEDYLKRHKENIELRDARYEYQKIRYGK